MSANFANMASIPANLEKLKTLIIVILDESGSMHAQVQDVIGGYNNFLKQQREVTDDKARLVLVKLNTEVKVVHGALNISSVPILSTANYFPAGGTALYDAVADGIRIGEGAIQPGERVLVLIMTDGEENASRKYGRDNVKELIASHEALGNWSFAYIGENPERWAKEMGQHVSNAARYDMAAQRNNFKSASTVTANFRVQMMPQQSQGLFSNLDLK